MDVPSKIIESLWHPKPPYIEQYLHYRQNVDKGRPIMSYDTFVLMHTAQQQNQRIQNKINRLLPEGKKTLDEIISTFAAILTFNL